MPTIFEAIKLDHDRHRALMATIADTTGASDARKAAWEELFYDIKSHAAAEEETFYAPLMAETWGQDTARHSVAEHKELDEILDELNDKDMASPGWLNRFHTFQHDYGHHMDEEEDEVFARARKLMSDEETAEIARRFGERKAEELKLVDRKLEDHLED